MEDIERLVEKAMGEIEKLLSTKAVVGEPMTFEGNTIIPLMSIGFAFGAAGASGKASGKGSGKGEKGARDVGFGEGVGDMIGEGTAGGGGIRPMALIIINSEGVRLESVKGGVASVLEKAGDAVSKAVEKHTGKKEE